MEIIDDLDKKILDILIADANTGLETIADALDISVGTVHNRIKRMKEEGVIIKIAPVIDAKRVGYDICVLIDVRIEGGRLKVMEEKLSSHPNVCSIYDVTGDCDTTIIAKFRDTESLDDFVKGLAKEKHVLRTSTKLVLNVVKEGVTPQLIVDKKRRKNK